MTRGRGLVTRAIAIAAACAAIAITGCHRDAGPGKIAARRAFYYWRTSFALSPAETRALSELHVDRLYLRVFDVAWQDGAPAIAGPITAPDGSAPPAGLEIVPAVYVENAVLVHLAAGDAAAQSLAERVVGEVEARAARLGFRWHELQLDCDWTDATRERYFGFLRAVRRRAGAGTVLSATIRLHQIKYRERTGVPPVDRGMLMFYNMGKFSADPESRAIFDGKAAARYLARLHDYPLPLDGALPIWSWTIQLRDDQVVGLLQSTDPDELAALDFMAAAGPDRYRVTRSTFLHGNFLREGDVLKIEVTGPSETRSAASMLTRHLPRVTAPRTIALFDLSERNLARHGLPSLDRVFTTTR